MVTWRGFAKTTTCVVLLGFLAGCGGGGGGGGGGAMPPAITTQPTAVTVADGATANFTVTATGDAPLSYQWRRAGADIAGATGAALALPAPYAFNASSIAVAVSNAAGTAVSSNALLTVTAVAPTIAAQPANAAVVAGAAASFSVIAAGGTAPLSYQLKRSGVAVAGATAANHTLASTALSDNGATFAVDVVNPAGTLTSSAATLTVTPVATSGKAWGPAVLLSSGDGLRSPGHPRAAIDAAGNALSVWQEVVPPSVRNAVWASGYTAGAGWSSAATIDAGVGNAVLPQLAMTPGGVAVASFAQTTSNNGGGVQMRANRFSGSTFAASTWGAPLRLDVLDASMDFEHRLAITPGGAATVAFNQSDNTAGTRATVAQSNAAGLWAAPVVVGAIGSYRPQVATSADGTSVMVWAVVDTVATSSLFASRNVGGAGWSVPVLLATGAKEDGTLRLSADALGNAIVVWQDRPAVRTAIRSSRLLATSGAWSAPVVINDGNRSAFEPELATDNAGSTLAVWYEANDGAQNNGANDYGVVAARHTAAAGWGAALRVQPVGAKGGVTPKIALDSVGNGIAVWVQSTPTILRNQEVWAAPYDAATRLWAAPVKLMTDPTAYALQGSDQQPDIAMNSNGEAVVVWYQRTDAPFTLGIWARVYR